MPQAPSAVLADLSTHLRQAEQDPTIPLDRELLDKCELFASTPEYRSRIWTDTSPLFLQIASLLPQLQQDASPLVRFATKLAEPYRFEHIKHLDFELGLHLHATPVHGLILSLLDKATASSADAQALANRPSLVAAVVRLWLCTADPGVATQAEQLLTDLLRVSKNEPVAASGDAPLHVYGTGPIWRRLFNDRDIVSLYYHYTHLEPLKTPQLPVLGKRDKTLAQARLLEWLPKVSCMDWPTITATHGFDIEREVGLSDDQGLLHYASLNMVDTDDDILMHMTLINFFRELLTTIKTKPHLTTYDSSLSLDFLKSQGIHKRIISFHTTDSPGVDHSFLSPRTAAYISDYARDYPDNFERSSEMKVIRDHVHRNIRKCEPHDLSILVSMPRTTLVPRRSAGFSWDDCILMDLPITRTNPDAIKTLAAIFHGPLEHEVEFPQVETVDNNAQRTGIEAVFARISTYLYYTKHPGMFSDIVTHIETIAVKENALAALSLLTAIVTSSWSSISLPDLVPIQDPINDRLRAFPETGLDLILDPALSGAVLPSLLKPAISFSNLVGGRGDAENAAYQIAMSKFDVLKAIDRRLDKQGGRQNVAAVVRKRLAEGPWGATGNTGSRIGTLDM